MENAHLTVADSTKLKLHARSGIQDKSAYPMWPAASGINSMIRIIDAALIALAHNS